MLCHSGLLQSAGIDWITLTQIKTPGVTSLKQAVGKIIRQQTQAGNDRLTWKGHGYYGIRSGEAAYGQRQDTHIATLSSETARLHWHPVAVTATNCSRLDLQLTILNEIPAPQLFDTIEEHLLTKSKGRGRSTTITRIRNSKGGNTIYIGSRKSDVYLRIYDKGVEEQSYEKGKLIRFEVELKRKLSWLTLKKILASNTHLTTISSLTQAYFEKHQISVVTNIPSSLEVARVERIPDNKRKLGYIANSVQPIVDNLMKAGYTQEVLGILFANPAHLKELQDFITNFKERDSNGH